MQNDQFQQTQGFARTAEILAAAVIALVLAGVAIVLVAVRPATHVAAEDVPAHHTAAPTGTLPDTVDPKTFQDGLTQNSYAMAAKIKAVL